MKMMIRILNKLGILPMLNLTTTITVNRRSVKIPLIGTIGFHGIYISEPWMIKILEHIIRLRNDGAYLDVGVNIGQTLIKVKSVAPKIEYFGFEPNPSCIFYLKRLIQVNQYENVTMFPVGISNEDRIFELSFFTDNDIDSAASIFSDFRPLQKTYRKEYVPCFTIKKIIKNKNFPKVSVIKIDVEGAEKEVLEELENLILRDWPYIQIEILPIYTEENTDRLARQNAIELLLQRLNYIKFRIYTKENNEFDRLEEIEKIGIHANLRWCDYLLVPATERENLKSIK